MRFLPRSLFGRLALLMVGGLVAAQLIGAAIHLAERKHVLSATVGNELVQRIAAMHRAIERQDDEKRPALAKQLSTPRQQLSLVTSVPDAEASDTELLTRLSEVLGGGVIIRAAKLPSLGAFTFDVYLSLQSGDWLRIEGNAPREIFAWPVHLFGNLALMLAVVIVLIWYATRMTVHPLTRLAQAAHALSTDLNQPPLPEDGPSEVREAARAFNHMQQRIRQDIEERERFLAAVSHDLRTPVTRLRLRSELLQDEQLRERNLRDLDEMQQMLGGALDFLRGKAVDEMLAPLDLVAMLESLVEDQTEAGHAVRLSTPASVRIKGRPQALRRAVGNLIDNALKYGQRAQVELQISDEGVRIIVEDEGPGLPQSELDQVFEPFYRVESSRNRETGGVGLGLAIVRQIARKHGGDVDLINRPGGGLRSTLWLPQR